MISAVSHHLETRAKVGTQGIVELAKRNAPPIQVSWSATGSVDEIRSAAVSFNYPSTHQCATLYRFHVVFARKAAGIYSASTARQAISYQSNKRVPSACTLQGVDPAIESMPSARTEERVATGDKPPRKLLVVTGVKDKKHFCRRGRTYGFLRHWLPPAGGRDVSGHSQGFK